MSSVATGLGGWALGASVRRIYTVTSTTITTIIPTVVGLNLASSVHRRLKIVWLDSPVAVAVVVVVSPVVLVVLVVVAVVVAVATAVMAKICP